MDETPDKGKILISEPFLMDPNFKRSIVLLCEHSEEGSVGFILNKPTQVKLNRLLEETFLILMHLFISAVPYRLIRCSLFTGLETS